MFYWLIYAFRDSAVLNIKLFTGIGSISTRSVLPDGNTIRKCSKVGTPK